MQSRLINVLYIEMAAPTPVALSRVRAIGALQMHAVLVETTEISLPRLMLVEHYELAICHFLKTILI